MKRFAIGRKGIVANVIAAEAASDIYGEGGDVFEDVAGTVNPGDAYDVKDLMYDRLDAVTHKILFQLVNDVRQLRGQQALTAPQYGNFVKGQIELATMPADPEALVKP